MAFSDQSSQDVLRSSARWRELTPSNNLITPTPRALYVGGSGNLEMEDETGNIEIFLGVVGGLEHPFRPARILESGTTATNIIALY